MKIMLAALAAFALSACMGVKNVRADAAGLQAGNYRTYVVSLREKPNFTAATPGKAVISGAIGATAMIVAGNKIIRDNDVSDPAVRISEALAGTLATRLHLQPIDARGRVAHSTDPADLSRGYGDADMVVDVATTNWNYAYFPLSWGHYSVNYFANLRLIDTRAGRVLAQGTCSYAPKDKTNAPTRDELLADKAARLKAELQKAADYCIPQFQANVPGVQ